jgi:hypothetical protein
MARIREAKAAPGTEFQKEGGLRSITSRISPITLYGTHLESFPFSNLAGEMTSFSA